MRIFFLVFFAFIFYSPVLLNAQNSHNADDSLHLTDNPPKTKVLILGTPHLSQIQDSFSPTFLDSLISILENYRPGVICIEALSGSQIANMERIGGVYKSVLSHFGSKQLRYGRMAQKNLGISWRKAHLVSDSLLERVNGSKNIDEKIRVNLVNYLLAAYRFHTAALQWSYLNEKRKTNQAVIGKETVAAFRKLHDSANESYSISLRLASKLKLQRVYPIDDHLEKDYYMKIRAGVVQALDDSLLRAVKKAPYILESQRLLKQGVKDGDLYPVVEYMNSPAFVERDYKTQWRNSFYRTSHSILRTRLALWEVRNLNIAAHIRKASSKATGGRILVTIGASHKSFLNKYLSEMMGVEIINLNDIAGK